MHAMLERNGLKVTESGSVEDCSRAVIQQVIWEMEEESESQRVVQFLKAISLNTEYKYLFLCS